MSLNMYLGEVHSQTQSMNAVCTATIQSMEQAIQSIDAFAIDTVLQGQTYSSAKSFFVQTFRPLAQGIIYLCEELIHQNNAFPNDFQSQVAATDVIEQEIEEQIREIDRIITQMEVMSEIMPSTQAMIQIYYAMRQKLHEKLEHLHEFNYTSSNNYDTALQLAASIAQGLAEVQSGKGFSPASGTFSTQGLNMEWIAPIQQITGETVREAKIKKEIEERMALQEQEANRPWYQKTAIGAWEFFQGICNSAAENFTGVELPMGNELESKTTFQAGNLVGNVASGIEAILEILGGIAVVTGSNVGTVLLEGVTFGAASPIVIPADVALTAVGGGVITHGGFVWYNTIQNSIDTLRKIQTSSPSSGQVNQIKGKGDPTRAYDSTKPMSPSNYPNPDPDFTVPPVRYEPKTIEEVERMRKGKGPTTKATHGDRNIEAHHRDQRSTKNDGILDDLEEYTHRRGGNHTRHTKPSELTPAERAKEIREHWKKRGSEYVLPGEGI
ncbi:T7SS effector LXG polymorphic toxin [Bacillus thuringiensis]|uniref:T7SS effector LXG polymorphic toxin n=1 Tax=Bacillus thuringiensis TaxID=1428 RepID=UPI002413E0A5|nr:T7SS effector LXG polymorphic toxin [Bacillus thuringiensis]